MARKNSMNGWGVLISFVIGISVGVLIIFLVFHNWAKPTGWLLNAEGFDTSYLSSENQIVLLELLQQGSLFTPSDLLQNFVTYYHMLISLLITILMLLAGFVTFNFYRSRAEYSDQMERELNKHFVRFEREILNTESVKNSEFIDKYEELQTWLNQKISLIVQDPANDYSEYVRGVILAQLVEDENFLEEVRETIKSALE